MTIPENFEEEACDNGTTSDGTLDLHGKPAIKSRTGGWKACLFIFAYEVMERMAFYGIAANLVMYLTEVLHQSLNAAAQNVNNWAGTVYITAFIGAFVADAYLGRFATINLFLVLYLAGYLLLTLSASLDGLKPPPCENPFQEPCAKASSGQMAVFYAALYIVAIGSGGMRPNISSLGADQFDEEDKQEARRKQSFFNFWYTAVATGAILSVTVIVYIQEKVNWAWGFGIPAAGLAVATAFYLSGSVFYRHQPPTGSPLTQVARVLVAALSKLHVQVPSDKTLLHELRDPIPGRRRIPHSQSFRFLDRAAAVDPTRPAGPWTLATVSEVEEVKLFVGMVPIWLAQLVFQASIGQALSLFTKQASAMDRRVWKHFSLQPANTSIFVSVAVFASCALYDRSVVPVARRVTGNPRGLTSLQRIGVGMVVSVLCLACAALVERKRRSVISPISVFWLVPQLVLVGVAEGLGSVGEMEFFYGQAPDHMRSVGTAFFSSSIGVGMFLASGLITLTNRVTGRAGHPRWIGLGVSDSRLDKFFWLLAALCAADFLIFLVLAWFYRYKRTVTRVQDDASEAYGVNDVNGFEL